MADVIPLRLMLLPIVYSVNYMADVIAITVADVMCFSIVLADVIANCVWQMLLPLRLMLLPTILVFC